LILVVELRTRRFSREEGFYNMKNVTIT